MTANESQRLELQARMTFANGVAERVVPFARQLPTYAGVYIDQTAGGRAVVLLTQPDPGVEAGIEALLPSPSRGLDIRYVKATYRELEAAMAAVWSRPPSALRGTDILATLLDERANAIIVQVPHDALERVAKKQEALQDQLGVQVVVTGGQVETPAICNNRDDCHTPFRAGIRITSPDMGCTMGFHIARNVAPFDMQFITTGHCSFGALSDDWSHAGFGFIGQVLETEYVNNGWDIMRVQMPDSEATNRIYGEVRRVAGRRDPLQGEAVCASLGNRNVIDCGTVGNANAEYNDDNGLHIVNAADLTGVDIVAGDSGSPVYVRASASQAIAVALAATSTSDMASKLNAPFAHWGAGVVVGGP